MSEVPIQILPNHDLGIPIRPAELAVERPEKVVDPPAAKRDQAAGVESSAAAPTPAAFVARWFVSLFPAHRLPLSCQKNSVIF
jgi:hypothetical protein